MKPRKKKKTTRRAKRPAVFAPDIAAAAIGADATNAIMDLLALYHAPVPPANAIRLRQVLESAIHASAMKVLGPAPVKSDGQAG